MADLTTPALDRQYHVNLAQYSCLHDEVERDVPRGSTVDIGSLSGPNYAALTEFVTPWAMASSSPTAPWVLDVAPGPCAGLQIVVRHR